VTLTEPSLQQSVTSLGDAVWALSALAAAVESGVVAALANGATVDTIAEQTKVPAAIIDRLIDVLQALGFAREEGGRVVLAADLAAAAADGAALHALRDDLRRHLGQSHALVADAKAGRLSPGWHFEDADVIDAQGTFALVHTDALFVRGLFPTLDGLVERLERPGARALDVGAGAAGSAIGFCRAYPALTVVGLEPREPSLAIGRRNVAEAGLSMRIELRPERVEDLRDEAAYDFVWLPQMFLDDSALAAALATCRRSLRAGGWLVSAWVSNDGGRDLGSALARLRNVAWGGRVRGPEAVGGVLAAAGLESVRWLPFGGGVMGLVGGRAPLN
jgi:SAM-dependent methyltransferase